MVKNPSAFPFTKIGLDITISPMRSHSAANPEKHGAQAGMFVLSGVFLACFASCGALNPVLDPPSFSHPSGAYAAEFDLSITSDQSTAIYYTLDGTDPSPSNESAKRYESGKPIPLRRDTHVKAKAYRAWWRDSPLAEADYSFIAYRFFVAGHVYGRHGAYLTQTGIHPEFKESESGFPRIKADPFIKAGFFVEDSLEYVNENECLELESDIDSLGLPVYVAPGNHDYSPTPGPFMEHFGQDGHAWRSFLLEDALCVILDGQAGPWDIEGEQLDWLRSVLDERLDAVRRIFVFSGKVLWVSNGHYDSVILNWREWEQNEINFWPVVLPLFQATGLPVSFFAGDVCAFASGASMSATEGNVSFYATGRGGGPEVDHYLVYTVHLDGGVDCEIVPLYAGAEIRRWNND